VLIEGRRRQERSETVDAMSPGVELRGVRVLDRPDGALTCACVNSCLWFRGSAEGEGRRPHATARDIGMARTPRRSPRPRLREIHRGMHATALRSLSARRRAAPR